jgi:hypothetical protein
MHGWRSFLGRRAGVFEVSSWSLWSGQAQNKKTRDEEQRSQKLEHAASVRRSHSGRLSCQILGLLNG